VDASDSPTAQQSENSRAITTIGHHSRWSEFVASLIFSVATFEMLRLYGIVHWQIMFRWKPETPPAPRAVFAVLGELGWLRLTFAVLALIWALWSFRAAPRWAAWVATGLALLALFSNLILT
jgi:hypothetical protein